MQYLAVVEKGLSSYGAFVLDLRGCVAVKAGWSLWVTHRVARIATFSV